MQDDLWIFGYGSLMWKPGFEFAETHCAVLNGYARRFCLESIHYRGTIECPGLVLALDHEPDHNCTGLAYKICHTKKDAVLAYVRERELISDAYAEHFLDVKLRETGETITAVTYVIQKHHEQYWGGLNLDQQAEIIAKASGPMGPNDEYLYKTVDLLNSVGVKDPELEQLQQKVRTISLA